MSETIGSASWTVEAAFGDSPFTAVASNTWTDITAYVRSLSTRRGRSHSLDKVQPGTCTLVLSNADRRFDPTHTAGPYYGDLLPNVKVRVSVTYDAVTYRVGVFFVNGWPQQYDAGNTDATVTVAAVDAFKLLAQHPLDDSLFASLVRSLRPSNWWRLGEGSGPRRANDSGSSPVTLNTSKAAAFGVTGLDAGSTATAYQGNGASVSVPGNNYGFTLPATAPVDTPVSLVALIAVPNLSDETHSYIIGAGGAVYSTHEVSVEVQSTGKVRASHIVEPTPGIGNHVAGTTDIRGRFPTTVCVVVQFIDTDTSPNLWVNGVAEGTDGSAAFNMSAEGTAFVAGIAQQSFGGTVQHIALFSTDISNHAADLAAAARTGHIGEQTGERLDRILDIAGWPTLDRDIATGGKYVGVAAPSGSVILTYCQTLDATEQGMFFAASNGNLTFVDIDALRSATRYTTSQATFSDDGSDLPVMAGRIAFNYDDTLIINESVVTGIDTEPQRAIDTTSADLYGERGESLTTFLSDERLAQNLAEYRVKIRKDPHTRPEAFVVSPERDPATIYPALCARDVGDRITVERTPQGVGSQIAVEAAVDSISWSVDKNHQVLCTVTASPVNDTDWFTWGTSNWGGSDGWAY